MGQIKMRKLTVVASSLELNRFLSACRFPGSQPTFFCLKVLTVVALSLEFNRFLSAYRFPGSQPTLQM